MEDRIAEQQQSGGEGLSVAGRAPYGWEDYGAV
jgi:hypothetical protein